MELSEIRSNIDSIDLQMRDLLMKRLDCSELVAQAKLAEGSSDIFRPTREIAILENLGSGVSDDRRGAYLPVVKKIIGTSRMFQYGLILEDNPSLFYEIPGSDSVSTSSSYVKVSLTNSNEVGSLANILSIISDYCFSISHLVDLTSENSCEQASFEFVISGDISNFFLRQLLFQLYKESSDFRILSTF